MFQGEDIDNLDEELPEGESSNRTFTIIAAVMGGCILLSAVLGGVLFVRNRNQVAQQNATAEAARVAQGVQIDQGLTQKAVDDALSQVPLATTTITNTPVIQVATTEPAQLADPLTVTVAAALTQAANAQLTVTGLPTTTALPTSGFADEAGLPGLVMVTFALVLVILLARRLRTSPAAR